MHEMILDAAILNQELSLADRSILTQDAVLCEFAEVLYFEITAHSCQNFLYLYESCMAMNLVLEDRSHRWYLDYLLVCLIINLRSCNGLLHCPQDHVQMLVIRLHTNLNLHSLQDTELHTMNLWLSAKTSTIKTSMLSTRFCKVMSSF